MLNYLIQIILFQALFFVVYELLLKKETFFTGNRVYLLVTQALVLILPLISIPQLQETIPQVYQEKYIKSTLSTTRITNPTVAKSSSSFQFQWIWILGVGSLIFFGFFVNKLRNILKTLILGKVSKHVNYSLVELNNNSTAFSFWNYIFLGNQISQTKKQEIIDHEFIHIKQKHSADLLFFEVLRIAFWFNPFVFLYQKRITDVHEYIVDQKISTTKIKKKEYFKTILSEVFRTEDVSFANSFYKSSLIKKRIAMLNKNNSKKQRLLKYLFVIPALMISLIYVANSKNTTSSNYFPKKFRTTLKRIESKKTPETTPKKRRATLERIKSINSPKMIPKIYVPECLNIKHLIGRFNNSLTIKNTNTNLDAEVRLIKINNNLNKNIISRISFINNGETHIFKRIPKGKYRLKIAYGNDYRISNKNGFCDSQFLKNASHETGKNILDFNPIVTDEGVEVPSYQLELNSL